MITFLRVGSRYLNVNLITEINFAAIHDGADGVSVRFDENNWLFFVNSSAEAAALTSWLAGNPAHAQATLLSAHKAALGQVVVVS